jgi:hypothetical protein
MNMLHRIELERSTRHDATRRSVAVIASREYLGDIVTIERARGTPTR